MQPGGMIQQHAVGIHQADLLAVAHKSYRLALHDRDANLIGQQAHHRGLLDPRNLLQLLAALSERNKEDVAPDVFAEDRQHLGAVTSASPVAWILPVPAMRKRESWSKKTLHS